LLAARVLALGAAQPGDQFVAAEEHQTPRQESEHDAPAAPREIEGLLNEVEGDSTDQHS
jgi:hypothetical protein